MAENKTKETAASVNDFIESFANTEQKKKDSYELIEVMREVTGFEPKMWGPSIIGFGSYHYKYASGHEGDAPLVGFSPRKTAISLYVFTGLDEHEDILENLGKFRKGKACIYVKNNADIDLEELKKIMNHTIEFLKRTYE
ncbi:DUF1801 domain-containing protein [Brumimicrobium aurantiacum]|uniref:DUF1801 domain-containing protein n=1 Tax=Brumimicrobium aurantiacum TaxID=1737063 RepID=A0A3E1EW37_9FLAO|nr:DUF1801 domain-containing protein [Brumimicrobium aurantiacum]RFC53770.1 DUF1801 domain-containing protein [Brumimicrobium aurantiacum]